MSVPGANEEMEMRTVVAGVPPAWNLVRGRHSPLYTLKRKHCANSFLRHNVAAMHPRTVGRLCQTPVGSSSTFHTMEPPGCERHRRAARGGERAGANESNVLQRPHHANAFTLIELLVVIAIIAILIGLLFPAFSAVQNQAKRTQAKNDLTQIVNAVNAFYTEYGQYPLGIIADTTYGPGGNPTTNETLFRELRGCTAATGSCPGAATSNPRRIVFISPPDVKNAASPRSGIGTTTGTGQYFDPWGTNYVIRIDGDYNNQVANPYGATGGAGSDPLAQGVIAWSLGKDQTLGSPTPPSFTNSDDVISWQ
jgi:prepilin-type N-terminal cleavage/methylation domain-containing protein